MTTQLRPPSERPTAWAAQTADIACLQSLQAGFPDPGVGGAGPPEALLGVQTGRLLPASSQGCPSECVCVLTSFFLSGPQSRGIKVHSSDRILP